MWRDVPSMKILIPIEGSEDETHFRRIVALAPLRQAEVIVLAHVIDTGTRGDVEYGRERYLVRRPLSPDRRDELTRAEEERARAGLDFARQALISAGVPEERLSQAVLRGKPKETLCDLAEREAITLTVVRIRSGKPGPHSLGKTARYLVDHAPGAVLLLR